MARATLKDPYVFDFLRIGERFPDRLTEHDHPLGGRALLDEVAAADRIFEVGNLPGLRDHRDVPERHWQRLRKARQNLEPALSLRAVERGLVGQDGKVQLAAGKALPGSLPN